MWIEAVTRDAIKLLGTAAWKKLALHWKIWGRKIDENRGRNSAVMRCSSSSSGSSSSSISRTILHVSMVTGALSLNNVKKQQGYTADTTLNVHIHLNTV